MRGESDFLASTTLADVFGLVYLLIAVALLGADFGFSGALDLSAVPPIGFALVGLATLLYAGFLYYTFKASQTVEGSVRPIWGQSQSIFTLVLSVFILSEPVGPLKLLAIGLIICGAVLSVYRPKRDLLALNGVGLVLLASMFVGAASVVDKLGLGYLPPLLYAVPLFLVPPSLFFIMMGPTRLGRLMAYGRKYLWQTALLALLSIMAYIFLLLALSRMEASVTIPLLNTFVIFTAVGGMVFLGEKEGWPYKLAGALLAFIGAVLIS